jgi:hypothetical protein
MTGVVSNPTRRDVEPPNSTVGRGQQLAVRSLWVYNLVLVLWLTGRTASPAARPRCEGGGSVFGTPAAR